MANDPYCNLIDQICKARNIEDPQSQYDTLHLHVDEVVFTLIPDAPTEAHNLVYFCDFGEPPAESRTQAITRMLEANLFMFSPNAPTFSCNPENGHVLLLGCLRLAGMTPKALLETLENLSAYVRLWRETCFLGQSEQPATTSLSTHTLLTDLRSSLARRSGSTKPTPLN